MHMNKVYITDDRGNVKEWYDLEEAEKEQDALKSRGVRTITVWYHDGWALLVASGKP